MPLRRAALSWRLQPKSLRVMFRPDRGKLIEIKTHLRGICAAISAMKLTERPAPDVLWESLALPTDDGFKEDVSGCGAWVEHFIAPRSGLVVDLMVECLGLQRNIASRLVEFGAVHSSPIAPEIPTTANAGISEEVVQKLLESRALGMEALKKSGRWGNLSQKAQHTIQKTTRIQNDVMLDTYSYVRVHVCPKRFPIFHTINWRDRILVDGPDFLVLHKPPGLPVPPTVDNNIEHALQGAQQGLAADTELFITSRIDHATEGIVVVSKTRDFVRKFNALVQQKTSKGYSEGNQVGLRKWYRAVIRKPDGPITHGLVQHSALVKFKLSGMPYITLISPENQTRVTEGMKALPCEMFIHSSDSVKLNQHAQTLWNIGHDEELIELEIELITGRTHQIRAQLAALGHPILGDTLYRHLNSEEYRVVRVAS